MPGAIVAAVAPALVGTIAGSILEAVIGIVISQIFSFVSQSLFGKKPEEPSLDGQGRTQMVRQPITARRRGYGRAKISGPLAFIHSRGDLDSPNEDKDWLHIVPLLCGHEIDAIEEIWLDDTQLIYDPVTGNATEAPWYNADEDWYFASAWVHLGTADQVADQVLIDETDGKWTEDHRLRGIAYVHVRYHYGQIEGVDEVFPGQIPQVRCVCRLAKVYDPRSGLTAWSQNAALCIADYMITPREDGGLGVAFDDLDWGTVTAAAEICDQTVTTLDGTEARYTCNGVWDTDEKPVDVLNKLLSSMAGTAVYTGGAWKLYAGAWSAPMRTLTEDDLRGAMTVTTALSRREAINGVRGTFFSPDRNWQPTDFPPIQSAAYLEEDDGEELWRDAEWNFTNSAAAAQRLGKIDLERSRRETVVQFPGKLTCLAIGIHDVVTLDIERYRGVWGASGKTFRVVNYQLTEAQGVDGKRGYGVDLTLKEEDEDVYAWTAAEEQPFVTAPDASMPGVAAPAPPTGVSAASTATDAVAVAGLTQVPRIRVALTPSTSAFVTEHRVEWQEQGEDTVQQMSVPNGATEALTPPLAMGTYDVRVVAIGQRGVPSTVVEITDVETVIDTTPPAVVTGLNATWAGSNKVDLAFDAPSDPDFAAVEVWRSTTNDPNTATLYREFGALPNTDGLVYDRQVFVSGATWYYWLKSVDHTGNVSGFSAGDSVTIP